MGVYMKRHIMKSAVIYMAIILAAIVVLGMRQVFFHIDSDFKNSAVMWGIIVVLGGFALIQILCLFTEPVRLKKLGFFMLHIGLIAVLAGGLLYFLVGIKVAGTYPVDEYGSSANAQFMLMKANRFKGDDYAANLTSFNLGITDFSVEYYDPIYDVYEDGGETMVLSDVECQNGVYDFGKYGSVPVEETKEGGISQTIPLGNDRYAVPRVTEKHFEASVVIYNREEGTNIQEVLKVNHPLRVNGWKIYLQSHGSGVVQLILKYDPGEYIALAGIWMIILGTILSCLVRRKEVSPL